MLRQFKVGSSTRACNKRGKNEFIAVRNQADILYLVCAK